MCGGMIGTTGTWARRFRQYLQASTSNTRAAIIPSAHQKASHPLGISTGGLISRRLFVAGNPNWDGELVEAMLVMASQSGGRGNARTRCPCFDYPCILLRSRVSKNLASPTA